MTYAIEVGNLQLRYGDFTAVDGLSFGIPHDGTHALLGRNGSGKSTVMSVIAGFRKATSGRVLIDGEPVFENPRATRKVCLIRESGDTVDNTEKIEEALRYAASFRPNWDNDYALALLERFNLAVHQKVGDLSRGQRSALAVTLGLASRAPVTMFDEAYLGMDAPSRYIFYEELLEDFGAHPRTILLSTHLIEEVSTLFETLIIIDKGRLLLHEDADRLRTRGATVTGRGDRVDEVVRGLTVLSEKALGGMKSVAVLGSFSDAQNALARDAGLDVSALPLQDLFVHLTSENGVSHVNR